MRVEKLLSGSRLGADKKGEKSGSRISGSLKRESVSRLKVILPKTKMLRKRAVESPTRARLIGARILIGSIFFSIAEAVVFG